MLNLCVRIGRSHVMHKEFLKLQHTTKGTNKHGTGNVISPRPRASHLPPGPTWQFAVQKSSKLRQVAFVHWQKNLFVNESMKRGKVVSNVKQRGSHVR